MEIFLHNKSVPGLSVSNSSVSDKPLILCCIQLKGWHMVQMEMNQGFQSGDHERQKGAGRKGCAMGTVEKEKELGHFQGCTGYYLCLIVLFLALLILSCFTEIT